VFPGRVDINRSPTRLETFEADLATELNILREREREREKGKEGRRKEQRAEYLALALAKTRRLGGGIYSKVQSTTSRLH